MARANPKIVEIDGVHLTLTDHARRVGLNPKTLWTRIKVLGMRPEEALHTKPGKTSRSITRARTNVDSTTATEEALARAQFVSHWLCKLWRSA